MVLIFFILLVSYDHCSRRASVFLEGACGIERGEKVHTYY